MFSKVVKQSLSFAIMDKYCANSYGVNTCKKICATFIDITDYASVPMATGTSGKK